MSDSNALVAKIDGFWKKPTEAAGNRDNPAGRGARLALAISSSQRVLERPAESMRQGERF
jgi:hypothetical protein